MTSEAATCARAGCAIIATARRGTQPCPYIITGADNYADAPAPPGGGARIACGVVP